MATGIRGYVDNYEATLNGSITGAATTINVQTGEGSAINTALSSADYVSLTIDDGTNVEIVHVTSVSTDALTVERGQEGTSGTAFADNVDIQCRTTAESLKTHNWVPIEVRTLGSASATVDFDISDGADYRIRCITGANNSTATLYFTVFTSGPTEQTSNYEYSNFRSKSNSSSFAHDRSTSASNIPLTASGGLSPSSGRTFEFEIELTGKASGNNMVCKYDSRYQISFGYIEQVVGSAQWKDTSNTLVQLRVQVDSGTISAGTKFIVERRDI